MAYIQCLLDAVVVVGVEEAVDFLRLVATEEVDVALDHVRWSARLLSAGLSVWHKRERMREREREREEGEGVNGERGSVEKESMLLCVWYMQKVSSLLAWFKNAVECMGISP